MDCRIGVVLLEARVFVSSPDLEAQATPRIKDALNAAIQRTGKEEFAKISGIETSVLDRILQTEGEYVPVAIITLACQVNRSHNDPDLTHSSISECLKEQFLGCLRRSRLMK